jgi:hypothetical protein
MDRISFMDFDKAQLVLSNLSKEEHFKLSEKNDYHRSYRALLALAKQTKDDPRNDGVLGLSCAIYGWMPTILKKFNLEVSKIEKPVECVRNLQTADCATKFLSSLDATSPVNNSWVGLSKLLHFLSPELFPIWDSRIAKHFGLNWQYQLNRQNVYVSYVTFMHDNLASHADMLALVADKVEDGYEYRPSEMRCLELLLFESVAQ